MIPSPLTLTYAHRDGLTYSTFSGGPITPDVGSMDRVDRAALYALAWEIIEAVDHANDADVDGGYARLRMVEKTK